MVMGEDQTITVLAQPDQGEAQQWRFAHVEALLLVFAAQTLVSGFALRVGRVAQIGVLPWQIHRIHDELDRLLHLAMGKGRAQAGMALQQTLRCRAQRGSIQRAGKLERHLHHIAVLHLCVIERMKQEALLERRQRQDVFNFLVLHKATPGVQYRFDPAKPSTRRMA